MNVIQSAAVLGACGLVMLAALPFAVAWRLLKRRRRPDDNMQAAWGDAPGPMR